MVYGQIPEFSKCAWCCYWGHLPQWIPGIKNLEAPHIWATQCVCAQQRTAFQKYSVWVEVSDKGTWRTRTIWGFKTRSLNGRWLLKMPTISYNPALSFLFPGAAKLSAPRLRLQSSRATERFCPHSAALLLNRVFQAVPGRVLAAEWSLNVLQTWS